MKPNPIIAITLLCTLFCTSCRKSTRKYYPLSAAAKELATLKPGSFLVFVDSLHPSVRDSLVVTYYENRTIKDDRDPYNVVEFDYVNSTLRSLRTAFTIGAGGSSGSYEGISLDLNGTAEIYAVGLCATVPPTMVSFNNGVVFSQQVAYYDSLQLNGNWYYKVHETEGRYKDQTYRRFYNNSHALIRQELHSDSLDRVWVQVNALVIK